MRKIGCIIEDISKSVILPTMLNPKKLFLLDAYALIYRAYFAFIKNPRINSKGLNTSAIFGFTNTLIEVINKQHPSHLAVVFDTKKPTIRHIEFPEYKAHREKMPEGISEALPYIDKLLKALKIPKLYMDGYEADDVIGTLAKKAEHEGFQVYMMTSDKDFAQLVSENIFMYRPGNKWQPSAILGIPEVLEKFDVQKVDQVIDLLGMMGDTADNIPGIPGIGKKTAQKFIAEYGAMEDLFEHTNELKGKIKEKVEAGKEIGLLSKKLATIITDVPIKFNEKQLRIELKDEEAVKNLFEELEFRGLILRVLSSKSNNQVEKITKEKQILKKEKGIQMDLFSSSIIKNNVKKSHTQHKIITTFLEAERLIYQLNHEKEVSVKLCTTSTDSFKTNVFGISFCNIEKQAYFIFLPHNDLFPLLRQLFENNQILIIGNDLKFQIKVLTQNNINVKARLFDIGIAHYLLQPDMRHDINTLTENYLNYYIQSIEDFIGRGKQKKEIETIDYEDLSVLYNEQTNANWKLYHIFKKKIKEIQINSLFEDIEMPLIKVLAKMEIEGIRLDNERLSKYAIVLSNELINLTKEIQNLSEEEFNIASPKQLGNVLFEKMKLISKPKKTKSGQYSTSEVTLQKIRGKHPIIEKILEYREIKKLLSTYVLSLPELINKNTRKIHTTFNQTVTTTGRLSSINPNLQNIPIRTERGKKIREGFIPNDEKYILLSADYSQIELRIVASLSGDNHMLEAFKNGKDIHLATAAKVYNIPLDKVDRTMRSHAKSVNFGIIYGISAFGLSQNTGISRTDAKKIIDEYFDQFPKVKTYIDWLIERARKKGFAETIFGRRRYLKDINSRNEIIKAMAERNAINAPIQGSAADIIKKAMISIQNEICKKQLKSRMLLQVHDELVFDMHQDERDVLRKLIKTNMENIVKLNVPLIVDLGEGKNWLEAH